MDENEECDEECVEDLSGTSHASPSTDAVAEKIIEDIKEDVGKEKNKRVRIAIESFPGCEPCADLKTIALRAKEELAKEGIELIVTDIDIKAEIEKQGTHIGTSSFPHWFIMSEHNASPEHTGFTPSTIDEDIRAEIRGLLAEDE